MTVFLENSGSVPENTNITARPRITMSLFDDPRPDGIVFGMANRLVRMSWIEDAEIEPILPKMARGVSLLVKILGVSYVERIECFR